jgi:hypothetical protein
MGRSTSGSDFKLMRALFENSQRPIQKTGRAINEAGITMGDHHVRNRATPSLAPEYNPS